MIRKTTDKFYFVLLSMIVSKRTGWFTDLPSVDTTDPGPIYLYMYLRKTFYIFISRYQGHCPTTKYDYGETYGEATTKYFQDYRSRVLSASADPYCKGGDFPTYYTHRPETVISNRARNRDRWLLAPKYSLTNIDYDRKEELKHFDKVILIITNNSVTLEHVLSSKKCNVSNGI